MALDLTVLLEVGRIAAAEGNVQFLNTATDGKHRNAPLNGSADQRKGRRITGGIKGLVVLGDRLVEMGWMHIAARTGDQQAVDAIQERVQLQLIGKAGHDDRHDARHLHGSVDIGGRRCMPHIGFDFFVIGGDGDKGDCHRAKSKSEPVRPWRVERQYRSVIAICEMSNCHKPENLGSAFRSGPAQRRFWSGRQRCHHLSSGEWRCGGFPRCAPRCPVLQRSACSTCPPQWLPKFRVPDQ